MTAYRLLLLAVLVPAWIAVTVALYRALLPRPTVVARSRWSCVICGDAGDWQPVRACVDEASGHFALRHTAAPVDVVDR